MARPTARLLAATYASVALALNARTYAGVAITCATTGVAIYRDADALRLTVALAVIRGDRATAVGILRDAANDPSISHLVASDDASGVVVERLAPNMARGTATLGLDELIPGTRVFAMGGAPSRLVTLDATLRAATRDALAALTH